MRRSWLLLSVVSVLTSAQFPLLAHAKPAANQADKPVSVAVAGEAGGLRAGANAAAKAAAKPTAKKPGSAKPCYAKPVQLLRVRGAVVEPRELSLTMCNGAPNPAALDSLSVVARPRDVERPLLPEIRAYRARPLAVTKTGAKIKITAKNFHKYRDPMFVTEKVMRVQPGLLTRLQKVAKHYPGKVIEIISGYRPDARDTSRHHHGFALDMRVAGVTREALRDFLRGFDETGVGYYPNSFFVHMDVRDTKGYWVDRSGPGEAADYGPWPAPTKQDTDRVRDSVLKGALAAVAELGKPVVHSSTDRRTAMAGNAVPSRAVPIKDRVGDPEQEERGDNMRQDEVAKVREEARRALQDL
ncbi:MAG: hypothetical protein RLZZ450_4324 [Pseudomonadota bacterium]|jgi:hypothetical protein